MSQRTISQFKRLGVTTCSGQDPLARIVRRMADHDISAVVVTDSEGYLAGIITRSDLLLARRSSDAWPDEPVERHMTSAVVTVSPEATLEEVVEILTNRHIHRVVVTREEAGRKIPIAVVSDSDLICEMADEL